MKINLAPVFMGFIIVTLMLSAQSDAEIDPGTCVAMWLFDIEDAVTAEDSSGNGNDGEFVGGPQWSEGRFGKALQLDGTDNYVLVPDSEHLDTRLNEGFTIVIWVQGQYVDTWHGILTKAQGWEADMSYLIQRDRDSAAFNCGLFPGGLWLSSNLQPEDDVWYHIGVRYNGNEASYFVNGELAGSAAYAAGIADTDSPITIGSNYPNADQCFQGLIDEVAIFAAALEQEDIQTIMENGLNAATGRTSIDVIGKLAVTWGAIRK